MKSFFFFARLGTFNNQFNSQFWGSVNISFYFKVVVFLSTFTFPHFFLGGVGWGGLKYFLTMVVQYWNIICKVFFFLLVYSKLREIFCGPFDPCCTFPREFPLIWLEELLHVQLGGGWWAGVISMVTAGYVKTGSTYCSKAIRKQEITEQWNSPSKNVVLGNNFPVSSTDKNFSKCLIIMAVHRVIQLWGWEYILFPP